MSKITKQPVWLPEPEDHDYPAATSYLSLIFDPAVAEGHTKALMAAPMSSFKAKDIFRASELALLGETNSHVAKNRAKMAAGKLLSPLLLIRDAAHGKVIVADGYHRLCAVYVDDEDALIPCKIA
jgi:hypothetical protein